VKRAADLRRRRQRAHAWLADDPAQRNIGGSSSPTASRRPARPPRRAAADHVHDSCSSRSRVRSATCRTAYGRLARTHRQPGQEASTSTSPSRRRGVVAPLVRESRCTHAGRRRPRARAPRRRGSRRGLREPPELAAGGCTLSNLGAYPVDFFTPVLSAAGVARRGGTDGRAPRRARGPVASPADVGQRLPRPSRGGR